MNPQIAPIMMYSVSARKRERGGGEEREEILITKTFLPVLEACIKHTETKITLDYLNQVIKFYTDKLLD